MISKQLKAQMQEPVVRSKTRRSIVQAMTSHVKFQSPKIKKNKKYREIALSKKDWISINDFLPKDWFLGKKIKTQFFLVFLKDPYFLKRELP